MQVTEEKTQQIQVESEESFHTNNRKTFFKSKARAKNKLQKASRKANR